MLKTLLKRRGVLGGGTVACLSRAVFRDTLVQAGETSYPRRFVVFHVPGGAYMGLDGNDNHFSFEKMLSPLLPHRSEILLFDRMPNKAGDKIYSQTNEGHGAGNRTLLTGDSTSPTGPFAISSSVDQIIAKVVGKGTTFSSLQFGVFADHGGDTLDHRRISLSDGLPLPPISEPATMFQRLFPEAPAPALPPPMNLAMPSGSTPNVSLLSGASRRRSVIDHLKFEIETLKKTAGAAEQRKLDQQLTSLRELEKQLPPLPGMRLPGSVSPGRATGCVPPEMKAESLDIPNVFRLQIDLLYQALICDLTRVATFQILQTGNQSLQFPWLGIPDSHHGLEHEQRSKTKPYGERLDTVQTWIMAQIAGLVDRLRATPEGSGTMLDNTIVLVCSELTGGDYHSHSPMLALTVGRGGGNVRPGRTMDCKGAAHNNLLVSLAAAMGVNQPTIGDAALCTIPLLLS